MDEPRALIAECIYSNIHSAMSARVAAYSLNYYLYSKMNSEVYEIEITESKSQN